MGFSGLSHAWRAVIFAVAMAWFGPAADLTAGALLTPGASGLLRKSAEPFGLLVSAVYAGGVREKWRDVERKLADKDAEQSYAFQLRQRFPDAKEAKLLESGGCQ